MAKMVRAFFFTLLPAFAVQWAYAQSYHALNGSSFAGVTAMYNNPASIVNQAYKWDVTLFGLQATNTNTAFVIYNNSILTYDSSAAYVSNGAGSRYLHADVDINLLNMRYTINQKNAVAFGFRLRTYNHFKAAPFVYSDTITTLNSFLHQNNTVNFLDGYGVHAGWAEINAGYSHVIFQTHGASLSAGITVSYLKSLSGAFARLTHGNYAEVKTNDGFTYIPTQLGGTIEYSDNYLITSSSNSSSQNFHNFLSKAPAGFSFDIGAEYLIKNSGDDNDPNVDGLHYDWKIGVSIMDIGRNKFNPIDGSMNLSTPSGFNDTILQQKTDDVHNIQELQDSLSTLFNKLTPITDAFTISLPTRLVVSVDHSLGNHFFINGEASLNFYSTKPVAKLHTREINLLAITPRWETQAFGVYLPIQYNAQGLFWVGAAVKLGPLLIGVHNLNIFTWLKTGTQTYNGGGYMLLSIHPYKKPERKINGADCPVL